ncbi:MAG: outer membrane integrity protein [Cytophagaceae bacterium]|nr:outer membrane integrity protein [Cytophagaceae bacterium]MDW8456575.1 AsmA-like C-terminal region-containing protein [Cytophagaceae bacterium]
MKLKKVLLISAAVFAFLLLCIILIPFLFKDKIKAAIDKELAKSVNAVVYYDPGQFGLSLIRNFPNFTVSLGDFGLIGKAEGFAGDTLTNIKKFRIVVDFISVIKGGQIKIKSIYLKEPYILTRYTKDGKFSWDITYPDTTAIDEEKKPEEEPSAFSIKIEKWEIENGTIVYDDQITPTYALVKKLNHKGKGDITATVYDISTFTSSPDVYVSFENVPYLNHYALEADVAMNIDMERSVYKFLDNKFKLNNFKFGFDGSIAIPDSNINIDIKYSAKDNTFKNLISLIPAIYMSGYEKLKADGDVSFEGYVKGVSNATSIPGFGLILKVDKAMMQYPDLPTALTNIATDLNIDCKDGVLNNMVIDLKNFHVDMGSNPIDAKALVKGMDTYDIDANIKAKVNLEDITKMFPVEGTTLKGLFSADVTAKGQYSDAQKLMPNVLAKMNLKDGYVKTSSFPEPLEKINFAASVTSNGDMKTSSAELESFSMQLAQDPFSATAKVVNFEDPNYWVAIKGVIDLIKINKLFPIEGTTMEGIIKADVYTKGIMSDINAGRYDKTATGGTLDITNLKYVSTDFPQGLKLSTARFTFSPEKINIDKMEGFLGKSDMSITGYFANYINYILDTTGKSVIQGKMKFASKKFDVNEWIDTTSTEADATKTTETPSESSVFEVPKNIDFVLNSTINEVLYDKMVMTDMTGDIIIKDGVLRMNALKFNTLDGSMLMNGSYNTQDIKKPFFDFDMDMKNIDIKQAYKTFNTVKKMAPIAENMEGKFSMDLKIKADLGADMMPVYNTMNGQGSALIASASIKDNKVLAGIDKLTQSGNLNPMNIKDTKIKFKIENGNVKVEPFDVKAGNTKMNISGSNFLDGNIDYLIKSEIPAGAAGTAANNAIANLTGKPLQGNQNVKLNFKVTGPYNNPKISLEGGSVKEQVKEEVKNVVANKVDEAKDKARAQAQAEADKILADAQAQADRIKAEAADLANKIRTEGYKQADDLQNKGGNPLEKAANKKLAEKLRKETDEKANRITEEANRKADQIMNDARNRAADKLK